MGIGKVLRRREMRLYVLGQSCSLLGDTSLWLAMAIWVRTLTDSNSAAGLVVFAFMLARLAAPVAGQLADALPIKGLLIGVNLLTSLLLLALLFVRSADDVWLIYVVAVVCGASGTLISAGQSRLLRMILPDELLGHGNAVFQTLKESMRLLGPLAGAGLFTWLGGSAVAILDSATYVIAAVTLSLMNVPATAHRPPGRWRGEFSAGLRYVWHRPGLRRLMMATTAAFVAFGFGESAIFAVVDDGLRKPPSFVGILLACQGAGALCAGPLTPALMARTGEGGACASGMAVVAAGVLMMLSSSVALVVVGIGMFGAGLSGVIVGMVTYVQRSTPLNLQGRTYAVLELSSALPQTAAIALGSSLLGVIGYRPILAGMIVFQIGGAAALLAGREFRASRSPA